MVVAMTAFSLFVVFLVYRWGITIYKHKLISIPRHCVKCGLPVRETIRGSQEDLESGDDEPISEKSSIRNLTRSIKLQSKEKSRNFSLFKRRSTLKNSNVSTMSELGIHKSKQLPTFGSIHRKCPTKRRIKGEVLLRTIRSNLRLWQARMKLRMNYNSYRNKCLKLSFWVLLLFYPSVSKTILSIFNCQPIADKHYLVQDRRIVCFNPEWYYNATLGAIGMIVWVMGVPLLFFLILYRTRTRGVKSRLAILRDPQYSLLRKRWLKEVKEDYIKNGKHWDDKRFVAIEDDLLRDYMKNKNLNDSNAIARVGFIYHSYENGFWWYEVLELLRKLIMNGLIVFVKKDSIEQILVGLFVSIIYLTLLLSFQPYNEASDDMVACIAQFQLFITLFLGLLLNMDFGNERKGINMNVVTYFVITTNVLAAIYGISSIFMEYFTNLKREKRVLEKQHRDEIRYKIYKLWKMGYNYAVTEAYLKKVNNGDGGNSSASPAVLMEMARRNTVEQSQGTIQQGFSIVTETKMSPRKGELKISPKKSPRLSPRRNNNKISPGRNTNSSTRTPSPIIPKSNPEKFSSIGYDSDEVAPSKETKDTASTKLNESPSKKMMKGPSIADLSLDSKPLMKGPSIANIQLDGSPEMKGPSLAILSPGSKKSPRKESQKKAW